MSRYRTIEEQRAIERRRSGPVTPLAPPSKWRRAITTALWIAWVSAGMALVALALGVENLVRTR